MRISIIIPVYNEEATISAVLARVAASPGEKELIVVDDGSTDATAAILASAGDAVTVCRHAGNRGKGAALRTGFARARGEIIIVQDADLEYDPGDYPALLAPILSGEADVVYGSRFLGAGRTRMPRFLSLATRFLTGLCNLRHGLRLSDMETCYKAFRREVLDRIVLRSDRFGFEPEFTIEAARAGFRFREVPVRYAARSWRDGKKIGWRDGIIAILVILGVRRFH